MAGESLYFPDIHVDAVRCYSGSLKRHWTHVVESDGTIYLYVILSGEAWIHGPDARPRRITTDDMISINRPYRYCWTTEETADPAKRHRRLGLHPLPPAVEARDIPAMDPGADATFFCIKIPSPSNPLPDILPTCLVIPKESRSEAPGLWELINIIMRADVRSSDNGDILQKKLIEGVAIQLTRFGLSLTQKEGSSIGPSYYDPRIRRVLSLMHAQPGRSWSLADLADRAGMSRSGFVYSFKKCLNEAPLAYLATLRMGRAASELQTGTKSIAEIAGLVGYQSESAFNKAFRRKTGFAPGEYRLKCRKGQIGQEGLMVKSKPKRPH